MRRDGTMRLADFVSAILHLTMAFELFKAKDSNQDNQIKMGLNEVSKPIDSTIHSHVKTSLSILVDQISSDMLIATRIHSRLK